MRRGPFSLLHNPDELDRLAARVQRHMPAGARVQITLSWHARLSAHWRLYRHDYCWALWALFFLFLYSKV